MKYKTLVIVGILALVLSCKDQGEGKFESIEPKEFAKKIDSTQNSQILDVRTPEEFMSEHIDKATNVNWNGADFEVKAKAFDKSKPVYVYCMRSGRSKKASEKLAEMGFTKIYELDRGIVQYSDEGLLISSMSEENLNKKQQ